MTITPSDAEVIADAIDSALIDVHVALPGCVQSYDSATQTATILLQVKRVLPTDDPTVPFATEDLPVLENVPVEFPRTKTFALTFPIVAGDYGLVVFSEMSLDQWRSKGTNTSPGDIGRHTLTGGVFRPGLMPNSEKIGDDISADAMFGELGEVQVRVKPGGVCEVVKVSGPGGINADDFVAQAGKVHSEISSMLAAGVGAGGAGATNFTAAKAAWDLIFIPPLIGVASTNLKSND